MKKLTTGIVVLFMAALSFSAVLIDWTPTSGAGRTEDEYVGTGSKVWNFSENALFANNQIYGGFKYSWSSASDFSPALQVQASQMLLRIYCQDINSTNAMTGMLCWEPSSNVSVANVGDSLLSAAVSASGGGQTTIDYRFIINQGGIWYVSDTIKDNASASTTITVDPLDTAWRVISTTDYFFDANSQDAVVFDDIQAVGLYIDGYRVAADMNVKVTEFKFTAVPEPATVGILGLGGLIAYFMRKKKIVR
ncbi:MAG: PEP-CTERM sorting domain-containing protein [Kiritimatiellales bacterium]